MFLHHAPSPSAAPDPVGNYVIGAIFVIGGALNLLAALIGVLRKGELRSTMGRQFQSVLGKRGTIAVWLVLGIVCIAFGAWLALRPG